ncbi:MAG: altronate dehydratase large subunit [Bacillota bacterium]|nr:altronate dehydratase large subunit [Bacillota bacterium]
MEILGYVRPWGGIGIRNHVLILPVVVCAAEVAQRIADAVPGTVAVPHQHGCGQIGADFEQTKRTLVGYGSNPNVAATIVVGLGCEKVAAEEVAAEIAACGQRVELVIIQKEGGSRRAVEKGVEIAGKLVAETARIAPQPVPVKALILGLECGGSDATSGLAANPALGVASDLLVAAGGTSILSETPEIMGAEHLLARRAVNDEVARRLYEIVARVEEGAKRMGVDLRGANPAPGNIAGGITTIEEKSLGCIYKAGTAKVQGVLEYAEAPRRPGLWVMDTPGHDVESVTGMVAGGAQIVVFTTGRGTPAGCAIAPVIKVTGNSRTFRNMEENIDVNAGTIIDGQETIEEVGRRIFSLMLAVARGELTKAEKLGHREFAITRVGPTF